MCIAAVINPRFKCVAFDLLSMAEVVDVCVVIRYKGKGTRQIDWVPVENSQPYDYRNLELLARTTPSE